MEKREALHIVGGNENWYHHYGKEYIGSSKIVFFQSWPQVKSLKAYPDDSRVYRKLLSELLQYFDGQYCIIHRFFYFIVCLYFMGFEIRQDFDIFTTWSCLILERLLKLFVLKWFTLKVGRMMLTTSGKGKLLRKLSLGN